MKKTKLILKRQTMAQLTPRQMRRIQGGNEGCPGDDAAEPGGGANTGDILNLGSRIVCTAG